MLFYFLFFIFVLILLWVILYANRFCLISLLEQMDFKRGSFDVTKMMYVLGGRS